MPGCLFRNGSTVFVLPDKVGMGSMARGLRCAVIQYMAVHGTEPMDVISQRLGTSMNKMRDVFRSMEEDGTITMMNCGGRMVPFLCDRRGWLDRMRDDEMISEMAEYRRFRHDRRQRGMRRRSIRMNMNQKRVDRARFELATSTMPM